MVSMSKVVGAMEALEEAARAVVAKPKFDGPCCFTAEPPDSTQSVNIMPNDGTPPRGNTKEDDADAA
jgi:hypothetical protein